MMRVLALFCLLACALAFNAPSAARGRAATRLHVEQTVKDLNLEEMFDVFESADKKVSASSIPKPPSNTGPGSKSLSVPFLNKPKNLNGAMVGDKQFDPIGFSDYVDVKFLREAELKHGRICMLAVVGWLAGPLAGPMTVNPLEAHNAAVQSGAAAQVLTAIAALEFVGVVALQQTMSGQDRAPGDFGFDPLGLSAKLDKKGKDTMALKELENGRLAMVAFSGIVTMAAAFPDKSFPFL